MKKLSATLLLGFLAEAACFSSGHRRVHPFAGSSFLENISDVCWRRNRSGPIASSRQSSPEPTDSTSKSGWHRRVTSVFHRKKQQRSQHQAPPALEATISASDGSIALDPTSQDTEKYLANAFDIHSPALLFPTEGPSLLESSGIAALDPFGASDTASPNVEKDTDDATDEEESKGPGGSPISRVTRGWFENALAGRLDRWSNGNHEDLKIRCHPSTMSLLKGQAYFDAFADFGRIIFQNIRMSGGRIEAHRLALNLLTAGNMPRFPKKFDFVASNVTFTQEDLFESSCIRNGLQRLLVRILKRAGVSSTTVQITQIEILPSNRFHIQGEATTLFNTKVPFAVRSGLASQGRGHILTFPGLEIALSPEFGLYIPILPEVTLDLGHSAQLLDVEIDGKNKAARASARVTITPTHTRKVPYLQSPKALAADYSIDVGRWLTKLGNFSSIPSEN